MTRWLGASIASAMLLSARTAGACLNDFEIALAEQQLRGAYAPPLAPGTTASVADIVALAGAVALVAALVRAGRVG